MAFTTGPYRCRRACRARAPTRLAYDRRDLVETLRQMGVVLHAAQKRQGSASDRRGTRHVSYELSQRRRPVVERVFAWLKWVAGRKRVKLRSLAKVS